MGCAKAISSLFEKPLLVPPFTYRFTYALKPRPSSPSGLVNGFPQHRIYA